MLEISSSTVKKYIRGLTLAGCVTGSAKSYYQYDAHGNVVQLTNASGVVTQSYDYDAFDNQFSPSLTDSNLFRYSGEYFDEETEFYYLRARQYSPVIGRFTQEDTYRGEYASPLSLNLYTYCYNDPVQYVDPTGHFAWDTFVDVISFSSSLATFVVVPTLDNLLWAAIDAAALIIPNVSSPMLRAAAVTVGEALVKTPIPEFVEAAGGALEAVTKVADDIIEAVKQADVADDVVVKAKTGRGQSRAVEASSNTSYTGVNQLYKHESIASFEKRISKLSPSERVAAFLEKARMIAKERGLSKDSKISKLNNRTIYWDASNREYYSVDTQHGRFEWYNRFGKHLGEVDFDFKCTKNADKSGAHDIRVR